MSRIAVCITLHIEIPDLFTKLMAPFSETGERGLFEDAVADVATPADDPVEHGYEIVSKNVVKDGVITNLTLTVDVHDSAALREEALRCYGTVWNKAPDHDFDDAEAIYEILVASNPHPAPVDLGFEIMGWKQAEAAPSFRP